MIVPAAPMHHHLCLIATLVGQGKGKENPLRHGRITPILTKLLDTKTAPTARSQKLGRLWQLVLQWLAEGHHRAHTLHWLGNYTATRAWGRPRGDDPRGRSGKHGYPLLRLVPRAGQTIHGHGASILLQREGEEGQRGLQDPSPYT